MLTPAPHRPSLPAASASLTNQRRQSPRDATGTRGEAENMNLNYKTWIGMLLLAGTLSVGVPAAFSQVSIGIQIGVPPAPRMIAARPPCPDPQDSQYVWIEGYWYPV